MRALRPGFSASSQAWDRSGFRLHGLRAIGVGLLQLHLPHIQDGAPIDVGGWGTFLYQGLGRPRAIPVSPTTTVIPVRTC